MGETARVMEMDKINEMESSEDIELAILYTLF